MGPVGPRGHKPVQEAIRGREHSAEHICSKNVARGHGGVRGKLRQGVGRAARQVLREGDMACARAGRLHPGEAAQSTGAGENPARLAQGRRRRCRVYGPGGPGAYRSLAPSRGHGVNAALGWFSLQLGLLEGFNLRKLPTSNSAPKVALY